MDGFVALSGEPGARVPIQIMRVTGASQSFSDQSFTGKSILV